MLAPNIHRALGRGRGGASEPPPGATELIAWLARNVRPGRRPGHLALLAFAAGLAIPESTVRDAFADAATSIQLPAEVGMPPEAGPEDVADTAAVPATCPRRYQLGSGASIRTWPAWGVNWSSPELAALDPGRSDPRLTNGDFVYNAVHLMLSGGKGIDMGTIGAVARALAPANGVAPLAGQIEYGWSISRGEELSGLPDEENVLSGLFGADDLRYQARDLAMTTPAADLLDAFHLAAVLPEWADGICAAAEQEIATGKLGEAAKEWITSTFGLTRLMLVMTLRDHGKGPATAAVTALVLIIIRDGIRSLRQILPAGNFEVLNSPLVAPPFLVDFLNR